MSEYKPKSEKRSVILYYNNIKTAFKMLPTYEERGELFTDICNYEMYETLPDLFSSSNVEAVFTMISDSIDINKVKWKKRCQQNYENRTK